MRGCLRLGLCHGLAVFALVRSYAAIVDAAIADERNALLRDDLNAAQLRTARALAETHARSPRRRLVK